MRSFSRPRTFHYSTLRKTITPFHQVTMQHTYDGFLRFTRQILGWQHDGPVSFCTLKEAHVIWIEPKHLSGK